MIVATVARRELAGFFHAPIAYAVGAAFLAVQGLSFAIIVDVLSDPRRSVAPGAVLAGHFGGTFLSWAILFALIAAIAMRAVAEERHQGSWESLVTTPADVATLLAGKWLGALAFYICLWLPTAAFPAILAVFSPPGSLVDLGPIAGGYLGVFGIGAALISLGMAASALTDNQIVAAVASVAASLLVLAAGELTAGSGLAAAIDLRGQLARFASGEIEGSALIYWAGLAALGLALAAVASARSRASAAELARRALLALGIASAAAMALALAARHPTSWDWTESRRHSLEPETREALGRVKTTISVTLVRPSAEVFEPVYLEVEALLERMRRAQPRLELASLDPLADPERVARLAADIGLPLRDLAEGGAVLFAVGARTVAVDLLEMASFAADNLGVGALAQFRAEEAFLSAIRELSAAQPLTLCTTTGRGELAAEGSLSTVAARWRREGATLRALPSPIDVTGCDVVAILGAQHPFSAEEVVALDSYLDAGGGLLVAAASSPMGLGALTARRGLAIGSGRVSDPPAALAIPGAFGVVSGYGRHPLVDNFRGRRLTVWAKPRPVLVSGEGAEVLAETSARGRIDEREVGEVPVAAISEARGRLIVLGSAASLTDDIVRGGSGNGELAAAALRWLAGRREHVSLDDKAPEHLRLLLSASERRAIFLWSAVGLPLGFALVGIALWGWRRRG